MEAVTLGYIVVAAQCHGWHYLFFPGLAALSHDVLTRPWGKWASQPRRLVVTPTLGALVGTFIARMLPFGAPAILLAVGACLLLLALLQSSIAPAIAAAVLPISLGIKSFRYPASVALSLVVLVVILVLWQRHCRTQHLHPLTATATEDVLESPPSGRMWLVPFFAFVAAMALCATASGLRLLLFPPLIVIAYEMFAHSTTCPWAGKAYMLPAACGLTAAGGWAAVRVFGIGGMATGCGLVSGVIALGLLRLRLPPALAVGLLPLVMGSASITFPISVAIGAGALTLTYQLYQLWCTARGRAGHGVTNHRRSV
ncbi:hypothetical protein A5653_02355 [Mycobacterium colombiense]|nr:hypothetical protein A5653_02355 [Mycobacterium colombiense]